MARRRNRRHFAGNGRKSVGVTGVTGEPAVGRPTGGALQTVTAGGAADYIAGLKAARERAGVTLVQIAESTKVSASLMAALERGDLSRWPKGIFRRSFFRDYVAAIGLAPDAEMPRFLEFFPDDDHFSTATADARRRARAGALDQAFGWLRRRLRGAAALRVTSLTTGNP